MLKRAIYLFIFFLVVVNLFCDSFQNGNLEFSNKNYENAKIEYLSELDNSGNDVNTLFNLGNTYIKLNKNGSALYTLYKARLISPRDHNINTTITEIENILNTNGQFKFIIPLSRIENLNLTFTLISIIAILVIILTTMNYFNKRDNIFYKIKNIYLSTLVILMLISVAGNFIHFKNRNIGIILETQEVLISPYTGSEKTFESNEGSKVKISDIYEDFIFITDNNGRYGWIEKENVGLLWGK